MLLYVLHGVAFIIVVLKASGTVQFLTLQTIFNSIFTIPVSPVAAKAGAAGDAELAKAIMARQFRPSLIGTETWEGYIFSGLEIRIKESTDLYGAVLWPSVHPN